MSWAALPCTALARAAATARHCRPAPARAPTGQARLDMLAAVAPRRGRRHPLNRAAMAGGALGLGAAHRAQAGQRVRSAARHSRHGSRLGEGLGAGGAWLPPRGPLCDGGALVSAHEEGDEGMLQAWALAACDELVIGPAHVPNHLSLGWSNGTTQDRLFQFPNFERVCLPNQVLRNFERDLLGQNKYDISSKLPFFSVLFKVILLYKLATT